MPLGATGKLIAEHCEGIENGRGMKKKGVRRRRGRGRGASSKRSFSFKNKKART